MGHFNFHQTFLSILYIIKYGTRVSLKFCKRTLRAHREHTRIIQACRDSYRPMCILL